MTRTQTKIYVSFHCKYKLQNTLCSKEDVLKIVVKNRAPITSAQGLKCFINMAMQQCSTVAKRHQSEVASPMGRTRPPRGHPGQPNITLMTAHDMRAVFSQSCCLTSLCVCLQHVVMVGLFSHRFSRYFVPYNVNSFMGKANHYGTYVVQTKKVLCVAGKRS